MLKIKFHPTFILLAVLTVWQRNYAELIATVTAAILHECGHALAAYSRGYLLNRITVMPYGAVLYGAESLAKDDSFFISAAGPLVSLLLAAVTTALWWVFPGIYSYTQAFCVVNLTVAAFNLLPVYPLDGGRMVLSLSKNPEKALKILKTAGIIFAGACVVFYIISLFIKANHSFLIAAVMLVFGAFGGTKRESYIHIAANVPYCKDLEHPVAVKEIIVSRKLTLLRLLKQIKTNQSVTFRVVDEAMQTVAILPEEKLSALCMRFPVRTALKDLPADALG